MMVRAVTLCAAAGLADDAEDLAFIEGEGDILDGGDHAARWRRRW
jgi:hypothetical protein